MKFKFKTYKSKGFTLIELVVVMVIVGVLAVVSVPVYTNYVKRATSTEGIALVGSVARCQGDYQYENSAYFNGPAALTSNSTDLKYHTEGNRFFSLFQCVDVSATGFTARTVGITGTRAEGITVELVQTPAGKTISVLGIDD